MSIIFIIVIKVLRKRICVSFLDAVDETYLNIEELLSKYWWSVINWFSRTIEDSTQHFN